MYQSLFSLSFMLISIFYSFTVNAQCVVADYRFSGNTNDSSGNAYHGVVNGSPVLTTDRFGNPNAAYEFNGLNDFIDTETTFDFQERTVAAWFMSYEFTSYRMSVLAHDDDNLTYGAFGFTLDTNLEVNARAGGTGSVLLLDSMPLFEWIHVTLVRKVDSVYYYINGQLVNSSTSNSGGSVTYANDELLIGVSRTEGHDFFHGKIDDVIVHDCALSASEINDLYDMPDTSNSDTSSNFIDEKSNNSLVDIYPNPTHDQTVIRIDDQNISPNQVALVDLNGRSLQFDIKQLDEQTLVLNRGSLNNGVYTIIVTGNDGGVIAQKRLILY